MIETSLSPTLPATVLHRASGQVDEQQARQGAAQALEYIQGLSSLYAALNLVLDLRGIQFTDLQAHRAWSAGFARHPSLQACIGRVAVIGSNTPQFRAEQELMATERVRFFVDEQAAEDWLASTPGARGTGS